MEAFIRGQSFKVAYARVFRDRAEKEFYSTVRILWIKDLEVAAKTVLWDLMINKYRNERQFYWFTDLSSFFLADANVVKLLLCKFLEFLTQPELDRFEKDFQRQVLRYLGNHGLASQVERVLGGTCVKQTFAE